MTRRLPVHPAHTVLSRRERQIMDILYRRGRATAGEVMEDLSGDPSYSTVRTQLRVLEEKGHVHHEEEGLRYVYAPAVRAARRASRRCAIWSTRSSTARPNRSVGALLGGEAARALATTSSIGSPTLIAKARKEASR